MNNGFHWNKWTRKTHHWGAIVILIPIMIIIGSGILLQVKKEIDWIQPPTLKGIIKNNPSISFDEILSIAKTVSEIKINSWADIDRLDVRINKGLVKVRSKNNWEVQIDTQTGKVLQVAYRRSDIIESIHDGSWFHDKAKLWIFLPTGLILLILWLTGVYMVVLPYTVKWKRNRKS
ncbi:MAG: PepSY domain-containing protein [Candidatus Marinimicrobia bacterium]|nr:PepSY domain-containing protein [Candidatus Neomarinimicrobiota bacterium]MBL7009811.1 PepSY domain-containing protein [Candidatus Neomarinimicrobiota bacterium]MBL7029950.1 PepSY domain-containing protein [Candidatus Neomarinimicrobiota bacterium]